MIVPALVLTCGPLGSTGLACLIAGECNIGFVFVAASWALGAWLIYMAWRTDLGGRHE